MDQVKHKYIIIVAMLTAACFSRSAPAQEQWSVGYWAGTNNVPVSSITWGGLTHVVFWTATPGATGTIQFKCAQVSCDEAMFAPLAAGLVTAAHTNGVKVLLGLDPSGDWSAATTPAHLRSFVRNVVKAVNAYGFDGVDNDWEKRINQAQYRRYLAAMRRSLGSRLLTATGAGGEFSAGSPPLFWASVSVSLDRFGLQTYDDQFYADKGWFNSALYSDNHDGCNSAKGYQASVDWYVHCYARAGFPPAKLMIGLSFEGYVIKGATGPRQPLSKVASARQQTWRSLVSQFNLLNPTYDSVARVPWIGIEGGWISFDNARSLTEKIDYVKRQSLGGWIIWNIETDYIPTHSPPHPLMEAIAVAMKKSVMLPPFPSAKDAVAKR